MTEDRRTREPWKQAKRTTKHAEGTVVDHPTHYNAHPSGIECIEVVRHMNFNLGNVIKYLWREGLKGKSIEDLRKAEFYLKDEIESKEEAPGLAAYEPIWSQYDLADIVRPMPIKIWETMMAVWNGYLEEALDHLRAEIREREERDAVQGAEGICSRED